MDVLGVMRRKNNLVYLIENSQKMKAVAGRQRFSISYWERTVLEDFVNLLKRISERKKAILDDEPAPECEVRVYQWIGNSTSVTYLEPFFSESPVLAIQEIDELLRIFGVMLEEKGPRNLDRMKVRDFFSRIIIHHKAEFERFNAEVREMYRKRTKEEEKRRARARRLTKEFNKRL
ncbi:MAG TPA: hypothetical protein VEC17_01045 [Candidatus Binatia bacterium]|nr:hypothetical protein [Candidatus Binatia bacterium]